MKNAVGNTGMTKYAMRGCVWNMALASKPFTAMSRSSSYTHNASAQTQLFARIAAEAGLSPGNKGRGLGETGCPA